MNSVPTIIFWLILGLLAYSLVTSFFSVLGARLHFETQRHNLLVRSKLMRLEYLRSIDEKMAGVLDDEEFDIVEEDESPAKAA